MGIGGVPRTNVRAWHGLRQERQGNMMRLMIAAGLLVLATGCVAVDVKTEENMKMGAEPVEAGKLISGQCHCGHVKYEAQGPVVKCSYCDCQGCRRATGTLKAPFVTVRRAGFKITAGEATEFRAASGVKCDAHGTWHFCPKCGAHVFWKGNRGSEIDIFAGSLDDAALFQPKD
jgi:hypothetical protein